MVIGTGRLSSGGSIALLPFREHGWLSALAPRSGALDAAALADRTDEQDSRPGSGPSAGDEEEYGWDGRRPHIGRERLEATDARIHVATARDPAAAGYATFTNATSSTATVVGLDCPAFDRVEMCETTAVGDVTVMRRMDSLTVLPGESIVFAPGGPRLMMTGARRALEPEELVGITVVFSSGRRRVVPFRVAPAAPSPRRDGR